MRILTLFLLFSVLPLSMQAQLDQSNRSVKFEQTEDNFRSQQGIKMPAREKPSLSISRDNFDPRNVNLEEKEEPLDMTKDDGLIENNNVDLTPKYFTKDKQATDEYARDQNLGQTSTGSEFVKVMYRDHEHVDGDMIRVFVNGDIVQSQVYLGAGFKGISVSLDEGVNTIEFQALNQGDSGPNTAELHVYDDNGEIISAREWNLLTGFKATIQVVKE